MNGTILEICVGRPREIDIAGEKVLSGIFKTPVPGPVELSLTNLDGDQQANLSVHGGRTKAVYVYSASHYGYWLEQLGRGELEPSQFGQNLTVDGLPDDEVCIGDRFRLGSAVVRVAQPRIPCSKLGARLDDAQFPNRFLLAGRLGYYLYVEEPGRLQAGDGMQLLEKAGHGITVSGLWRNVFSPERDPAVAAQALEFPHLDEGWKKRLRRILSP